MLITCLYCVRWALSVEGVRMSSMSSRVEESQCSDKHQQPNRIRNQWENSPSYQQPGTRGKGSQQTHQHIGLKHQER